LRTRCVFLDRDGVINEKAAPPEHYIRSPEEFRLLPNIAEWIRLFNALECLVIVITNQRGAALGFMTEQDIALVHEKMLNDLAAKGARIDDVFYCPHDLDCCSCRKPRPGLVYAARDKWHIDLAHSVLLGDTDTDEQLATNCGIKFLRVVDGRLESSMRPIPDRRVSGLGVYRPEASDGSTIDPGFVWLPRKGNCRTPRTVTNGESSKSSSPVFES